MPDVWRDARVSITQALATSYYPREAHGRDIPCLGFCTFTKAHQHVYFRPVHSVVGRLHLDGFPKLTQKEAGAEGGKLRIGAIRHLRASLQKPKKTGLQQH